MRHPKERGVEEASQRTPQEQRRSTPVESSAEDESSHDLNTMGGETDINKIAKGWSIAMHYSKERFRSVYNMDQDELDAAVTDGRIFLETTCLFVHAAIKQGQYRLPAEFWRILHLHCGIVVYPSAMIEAINLDGVGRDRVFIDAYAGHISMIGPWTSPMPDPFEYLQEPPPVYVKDCSSDETILPSVTMISEDN